MDDTRPKTYSPRELLNQRGLSRDPVGGNAPPRAPGVPEQVRERGLTFPATVTNLSQELLPRDNDRKFLFIQNNDALGTVTLAFGGAGATLGIGIRLAAGGGAILLDINVPNGRLFAIGSIANNPNVVIISG